MSSKINGIDNFDTSKHILQTSPTDATIGSVLVTGAQPEALGARVISDLNAATHNGVVQGLTAGGNVIESYKSGGWLVTKFADGTMFMTLKHTPTVSFAASGALFVVTNLSTAFPESFIGDMPVVIPAGGNHSGGRGWGGKGSNSSTLTTGIYDLWSTMGGTSAGTSLQASWMGRWKA